jgi:hypothetical protein
MVAFWKEIAQKVSAPCYQLMSSDVITQAPHHSRASWMKFYRRHKHELNHTENDDPLPQAPEKKMRYSRADDVLLAKFFFNKPDGTSDKIFQAFGRLVSPLMLYRSLAVPLIAQSSLSAPTSPMEGLAGTPQDP